MSTVKNYVTGDGFDNYPKDKIDDEVNIVRCLYCLVKPEDIKDNLFKHLPHCAWRILQQAKYNMHTPETPASK